MTRLSSPRGLHKTISLDLVWSSRASARYDAGVINVSVEFESIFKGPRPPAPPAFSRAQADAPTVAIGDDIAVPAKLFDYHPPHLTPIRQPQRVVIAAALVALPGRWLRGR